MSQVYPHSRPTTFQWLYITDCPYTSFLFTKRCSGLAQREVFVYYSPVLPRFQTLRTNASPHIKVSTSPIPLRRPVLTLLAWCLPPNAVMHQTIGTVTDTAPNNRCPRVSAFDLMFCHTCPIIRRSVSTSLFFIINTSDPTSAELERNT